MNSQGITDPIANLVESIRYARQCYGASDAALKFRRLRGPDKIIEPTEKDWALYWVAIDALNAADKSPFIYVDAEVEKPEPRRELGDYIETEDEYRQRATALAAEHGFPDDLNRALSMAEWRILTDEPRPATGLEWKRRRGYGAGEEA